MNRNQLLYDYLEKNSDNISNEWFETFDEADTSFLSSSDPDALQRMRMANSSFNRQVIRALMDEDEEKFAEMFEEEMNEMATGDGYRIPLYILVKEFLRYRNLFITYIKKFVEESGDEEGNASLGQWNEKIINAFDIATRVFVTTTTKKVDEQMQAQQKVIHELGSPVITLRTGVALLPLIGEIDTSRANNVLESTLQQCVSKDVEHLYLDLSGVAQIDTMVAHQLIKLMTSLKTIGVRTTISGVRPEVAQTLTHLGFTFHEYKFVSNLEEALARHFIN